MQTSSKEKWSFIEKQILKMKPIPNPPEPQIGIPFDSLKTYPYNSLETNPYDSIKVNPSTLV